MASIVGAVAAFIPARSHVRQTAHDAATLTVEHAMIDMNQLLTSIVAGGAPARAGQDAQTHQIRPGTPMSADGAQLWSGPATVLGAGALAGGLSGLLMGSKRMRDAAGTVLQVGAVAAIGGLAYKAYQNYRLGRPVVPQSVSDLLQGATGARQETNGTGQDEITAFIPPPEASNDVAMLLLRAMVAAAAADGHLDKVEYGRIRQHLQEAGIGEDDQLLLSQAIMRPSTISELAEAATTPALRAEVYAAARLAIDTDTPLESDWLRRLADALSLDAGLRAHLDAIGTPAHVRAA
jgi:uncharacterized membrane protein YebE (DUF533 family)